jgi:Zn-dependent protease with chaperone function
MRRPIALIALAALLAGAADGQSKKFKPGFNLFSPEQDIQLGQEAAREVEKQFTIVRDPALAGYIDRIGKQLASSAGDAGKQWPFTFKVVHEDSINAFALPGGPMFIHTGLIKAAGNEAQLAGVMAHEMSHVILRHGTNNVSKQQMIQLPVMMAGAMAGNGSMVGLLSQLGIQLGAGSLLLKMSRGAEKDADLLGANIMHSAGYNPLEMARFFEVLEKQSGNMNKLVLAFTSDHPNPGDRVKSVENEITTMPRRASYDTKEGDINAMKAKVAALGAAPKKAAAPAAAQAPTRDMTPSAQSKRYSGGGFQMDYPDNWQVVSNGSTGTLVIAPKQGVVAGQGGQNAIGYGVMVSSSKPASGRVELNNDTRDLVKQLQQSNPGLQVQQGAQQAKVDGQPALVVKMLNQSPFQGVQEVDLLVTVDRGDTLFYALFIVPQPEMQRAQGAVEGMIRSIRFAQQ